MISYYEKRTLKTALKAIKSYKNGCKSSHEKAYLCGKVSACTRILSDTRTDLAIRIQILREKAINCDD